MFPEGFGEEFGEGSGVVVVAEYGVSCGLVGSGGGEENALGSDVVATFGLEGGKIPDEGFAEFGLVVEFLGIWAKGTTGEGECDRSPGGVASIAAACIAAVENDGEVLGFAERSQ